MFDRRTVQKILISGFAVGVGFKIDFFIKYFQQSNDVSCSIQHTAAKDVYEDILEISPILPSVTLFHDMFSKNAFGSANIDLFKGTWISTGAKIPDEPMCIINTSMARRYRGCNYSTRAENYAMKYVAPGLKEVNATFLVEGLKRIGPILFAGDSLSGEMFAALECFLKREVHPSYDLTEDGIAFLTRAIFGGPIDGDYEEWMEVRLGNGERRNFESAAWVEKAISLNASYVVFNSGAWWGQARFRQRGEWCNWENWTYPSLDELVQIYESVVRNSLSSLFLRLLSHNIKIIYRDTAPGGITFPFNSTFTGRQEYHTYPAFNRIARVLNS